MSPPIKRFSIFALVESVVALLLLTVVAFGSWGWMRGIESQEVFPDEPIWVMDSQYYQHRLAGDYEKFTPPDDVTALSWGEPKRRLLDQPQGGKYIFGYILSLAGYDFREYRYEEEISKRFVSDELKITPEKLRVELGESLYNAVLLMRSFGTLFGLITIYTLGGLLYLLLKERIASLAVIAFLLYHPLLLKFFRLAVLDVYSVFLLLLSVSLFIFVSGRITALSRKEIALYSMILGTMVALATSLKLNGLYLLMLPPVYGIIRHVVFYIKERSFALTQFQKELFAYELFFLSFAGMFFFLEPEFWSNPYHGISSLIEARTFQQTKFLAGHSLSLSETFTFLLKQIFFSVKSFPVSLGGFLFAAIGVLSLSQDSEFISRQRSVGLIIALLFIANATYARVGFFRYAIPSLFALSFFVGLGIQQVVMLLRDRLVREGLHNTSDNQ